MTFPATLTVLLLLCTGVLAWLAALLLGLVLLSRALFWAARSYRRRPGRHRAPRFSTGAAEEAAEAAESLLSVAARCPAEGLTTLHVVNADRSRTCRSCAMTTPKG